MNVKERLYKALTESEALTSLLAEGSEGINKDLAPSSGKYPQIVYSLISDVPKLSTENKERLSKITVQISVITENGQYGEIEKEIKKIMHQTGFCRDYSGEICEDGKKIKIMRYVKLEEEE